MNAIAINHVLNKGQASIFVTELEIPSEESALTSMYESIGCRLVERVELTIQGKDILVWLNEEGLFADYDDFDAVYGEGSIPSWLIIDDMDRSINIAGNIVITGLDEEDMLDCPFDRNAVIELVGSKIHPQLVRASKTQATVGFLPI